MTRSVFLVTIVACAVALTACAAARPPGARVAPGGPAHLVDRQGRWLSLRGVAVTGLVEYPGDYAENPPITRADLAEIAALGFDYVRLPVSWSRIEPRRGQFDGAYLDRVARVVRWAGEQGLRVVVDGHFDRYNRSLDPGDEADGAPGWATVVPRSCVPRLGSATCVQRAWQSFWTDAGGVQGQYVRALVALSRRLRGASNLLGLELMNNPSTGYTPSPAFEQTELWPFYRRAITALRDDGERRPLWLDENAGSETTGRYGGPTQRLPGGGQLVFAPHDYAGVFSGPTWPAGGVAALRGWYADTLSVARRLGVPTVLGEWGIGPGVAGDAWIAAQLELQAEARLGSAFWMWKQRAGFYDWPVVEPDGSLRGDTARAQILGTPHPDATPGTLLSESYAPGGALTVRVSGRGGVAVLWSGAIVRRGGLNLLPHPLISAAIDGHAVPAAKRLRAFVTPRVALGGYVVSVRVPPGTHTVVLR